MSYPAPPFGTMPTPKGRDEVSVDEWVDDVFAQQGKRATLGDEAYWYHVLANEGAWDFGYIYNRMIEGQHAGVDPRTPPTPPTPQPEPTPEPTPETILIIDRKMLESMTDDIMASVKRSEEAVLARIDSFENDAKKLMADPLIKLLIAKLLG